MYRISDEDSGRKVLKKRAEGRCLIFIHMCVCTRLLYMSRQLRKIFFIITISLTTLRSNFTDFENYLFFYPVNIKYSIH